MSHIDEGLLHAYLDGETDGAERSGLEQHLDVCAECRTRLAEARTLRDRSAAILSGSGPATVTAPPFEQVVARSRAVETRRRVFRLNRLAALGWAATIVLAVGVGWIARGSLGFGERPAEQRSVAVADSTPEQAADVEAGVVGGAPAQVAARESTSETEREARRDEAAPTGAAKSEVAAPGRAEGQLTPETEQARAKLAEAEVEQQPAAGVAIPVAPAPVQVRTRGAVALADSADQEPAERRAAQPAAAAEAFAAHEVDLDALVGLPGEGAAWNETDEQTARELLGAPLLRLPDAAVVAYLVPAEEGRRAVQLVQRLASGEVVVLRQEAVAAIATGERVAGPTEERAQARDELKAMNEPLLGTGLASATVRRGDYLLTLRGTLPPDSLQALLDALP